MEKNNNKSKRQILIDCILEKTQKYPREQLEKMLVREKRMDLYKSALNYLKVRKFKTLTSIMRIKIRSLRL